MFVTDILDDDVGRNVLGRPLRILTMQPERLDALVT